MSISHRLYLETSLSPKEVEEILLSTDLGLKFVEGVEFVEGETEFNNSSLYALGVSITPRKASNLAKEIALENYGFVPDISIGFHLLRHESDTAGEITAEKLCATLLAQESGNAIYFYNSDNIAFKRIKGKLKVYEGWTEYLIPELDKLGVKYQVENLEDTEQISL